MSTEEMKKIDTQKSSLKKLVGHNNLMGKTDVSIMNPRFVNAKNGRESRKKHDKKRACKCDYDEHGSHTTTFEAIQAYNDNIP